MLPSNLYHPNTILFAALLAASMVTPCIPSMGSAQASPQQGQAGLRAAVEAAWQKSVQARTLEARREEVSAGSEAAQSWIAGSPVVGLSQRNERQNGRTGARETEVSLSAPIWRPGQQSTRQALAQAMAGELDALIANARLTLAGEVRERFWALAAAEETLFEMKDHTEHLEELAAEVMQRVQAGDLARTDGMLAQQEVLAARAAVNEAQARLNEARAHYQLLTGQSGNPPFAAEAVDGAAPEPHPRLIAARSSVQRAQAGQNEVHATQNEPPTLGIALRQEKDSSNTSRSIGVSLQIPLGTGARSRPMIAAAQTRLETASAELNQVQAALAAEVKLAREQLDNARDMLGTLSARTELTREHARLIEKAFKLGERALVEHLRAQSLTHDAHMQERQQRVALGLAHARLNQAMGILP